MKTRRHFIRNMGLVGVAAGLNLEIAPHAGNKVKSKIACQQYPWFTFFERENKDWGSDLDYSMQQVVAAGFEGFEPSYGSTEEIETLAPQLQKHRLQTYSLYVNSLLHDPAQWEASASAALQIALAAKPLGAEIIVTNPSPIRWGGAEDKTDEQLQLQARALNELGARLRKNGLILAYHNHDAEMRNSAREFHHMMLGTEPENVRLCLDAHWIYRGSGDSQVALFDLVKLYADRIEELHLRQSKDGIWTEAFGPGDIDYERLVEVLLSKRKRPHLVLEQAVEKGSPETMDAVEAHRQSLAYAEEIFAEMSR